MNTVLHKFITEPLFDATEAMLTHLHIRFTAQSKTPLEFAELYADTTSSPMPVALKDVVAKVNNTYLIGAIDENALDGRQSDFDIEKPLDGKYQTMLVFAVDLKSNQSLTRSELATLTRGFNRMAPQLPVVVFVKSGNYLSLATCERSEYKQDWREGEKFGKVSMLRDINCGHLHRGHIDILESLGDKAYPTFDELYAHWLDVFSSELLTKKFYTELSEWYAWVIGSGKVKFPNDISTTEDDMKYNHEAVIRLITRLIFVWFLKQKKLIPEDFFDENAIRDNFIENFDPHSTNTLFYNPEESKYYRLILQNLFFAMLNRPIKEEESGNEENRRFATAKRFRGVSQDFNINNLMRYQSEFRPGGADKLLEIANSCVPFLNGGLFECLDHKDKEDPEYGMYFDGFSENKNSLEQLSFPDYFFFGEEALKDVDLSEWYDDKKKSHVKVRGLINILRSYNFTIEENTPLDQEVSLDPELLGKVFENLLASYNQETNTSARKQTGSFYTPRDIVKYMVDESLIAHLKRTCPDIPEDKFRDLLSYADDNFSATDDERKQIMSALYNCKVLDPACGSGAFPMGVLQQMVHALRKLDPTNKMWRDFILDISLQKDKEAYQVEDEEERKRLRADIEQSFNRQVNDPDYARKLYLIENCIYGVDIQPIAVQISKLRFFISLVAEQKPTSDPLSNFGIRPLPNLEAKFVAANSLVPLDKASNLFATTSELDLIKKKLTEANHAIFRAKNNRVKRILKTKIDTLRKQYANELLSMGAIGPSFAQLLADWNMFNQNRAAKFLDIEWMFGIKNGFDIIIGNPPYVSIRTKSFDKAMKALYKEKYSLAVGQYDIYILFIELAYRILNDTGVLSFIVPTRLLSNENFMPARKFLKEKLFINSYVNAESPFESVAVEANIMVCSKFVKEHGVLTYQYNPRSGEFSLQFIAQREFIEKMPFSIFPFVYDNNVLDVLSKIQEANYETLGDFIEITRGFECGYNDERICSEPTKYPLIKSEQISDYIVKGEPYLFCRPDFNNTSKYKTRDVFEDKPKLVTKFCSGEITFALDDVGYYNTNSVYNCKVSSEKGAYFLLGILNAPITTFWFNVAFMNIDGLFPHIQKNQLESIPIPCLSESEKHQIIHEVKNIMTRLKSDEDADISASNNIISNILYHYYNLSYDEVLIIDPETTITEEEYDHE